MKNKRLLALLLIVLFTLFGFAACGGSGSDSGSGDSDTSSDASVESETEADAGVGPGDVAGVYFQPVDMEPAGNSLSAAESDFHIEADISALANNELGYGAGSFVPNLTVNYEIADESGAVVSEGAFMPMSASDGPHYGANVSIGGKVGNYHIKFIIENPEAQGYLLHTDQATGVEGRFWTEPLVAEWDFEYTGPRW
jgi:uncharacterized protein involved in high-affinity Fe2+ transport